MQIFISWSGAKSKAAAEAFRDWLPDIFHTARPWISSEDIAPGKRWSQELHQKLEQSYFGIICVTRQNLNAPWILFEAGNLSKAFDAALVCPVLIDLSQSDTKESPLSQFQGVTTTRDGIFKLVSGINKCLSSESLPSDRLQRAFEKWWPDIETKLRNLPSDEVSEENTNSNLRYTKIDYEDIGPDYYFDEVFSRNIRDFICYHQGNLIQYLFLAGEHHKNMKTAFNQTPIDTNVLIEKRKFLIDYLNQALATTVIKSFDEIQKMYFGRHSKAPRICLKANFGKEQKSIIALFREKRVGYNSNCEVNENTAFQFIKENGTYYLCQDIPESARNELYINPRLMQNEVVKYNPRESGKDYHDEDWVRCWRGNKSDTPSSVGQHYRNCYKSTLIIPLTLLNNRLGKKFIEKFNMKDVDRTIFGYLCFDHITTDYFDPTGDVNSGYVFADVLSLYLLIRFIYVNQSRTYTDVIDYLKANGVTCEDDG